jgi:hypothetical protein
LDVLKVDLVLHLSSSHLLLHRLSWNWQGIHTNEGWAMSAGRGSCVRRVQAREWTLAPERDGRWAEGATYVAVWEHECRHVVRWTRRAGALLLRWCAYVRKHGGYVEWQPCPNAGLGPNVRVLDLPFFIKGTNLCTILLADMHVVPEG